ncbi:glutamate decarboxylase [Patellaria atrata CBS 101060]|uniref:glutamate decarboxylase n=1 Tax=Patellaria atrata CBS 101060 TaxID=1346257 RepID=A0A9P4VNI0_9PEZI|nr:glutamate decarboxylase [Patellaria atrata CBS 101060]
MAGLARHVDPDGLMKKLSDSPGQRHRACTNQAISHSTPYSSRYASASELSKFRIPHDGAPAEAVHQLVKDELDLDGSPNLNLSSFVGTYMEHEAEQLLMENISKNMADADEYPAMTNIHARCISILVHLWGVQKGETAIGSDTTGSLEAVHLGGLAMKRRWQEKRDAEGKDKSKPNIIMGANAQVTLEKFARYFEVEARLLPVSAESHYQLDPDLVRDKIDKNTIGVFVILGFTYTGHFKPVEEISKILDAYEKRTGVDIPIHVDAASGGFIAPFTHAKAGGSKWNIELPRIIWRDESYLPKHLIFELHYPGGTEQSYTLNFSRPGAHVIAQYFNLIHLGFTGYRIIMENALANARLLSRSLETTGWYECISDIHRKKGDHNYVKGREQYEGSTSADYNAALPVVTFYLSKDFRRKCPHVKQVSINNLLRARQYIVPSYALPPNEDKTEILRDETVMDTDLTDILAWQPGTVSIEKEQASAGEQHKNRHKTKHPMSKGIHRSVY